MSGLGKAIGAAITYIIGFIVFKTVYAADDTSQWTPLAISLVAGIPVVILAVGVASMLIRPSPYKEIEKQVRKKTRYY